MPLRQDDEDLHLGHMRSPAHVLVNPSPQERQLRFLGAIAASGAGFLLFSWDSWSLNVAVDVVIVFLL